MTHFKILAGIDCGVDKTVCTFGYPENCFRCLSKKFNEANFLMDIIEATEQHSEHKRKAMLHKHIWRKYHDISTIRHVIVLSRGGLPAFNMAIGDLPIDAALISGFIQANVAFSSEELTLMDKINPDKKFYEFEYKHFHILLMNGLLCRTCLILEKKASNSLKELLSNFTEILEDMYENKIKKFEDTGDLSLFDPVKSLVEKTFEVTMIYPLTLSSQIPPNIAENMSPIQKAIYECSKDLLKEEVYFFISPLIEITSKFLRTISDEEILWNTYQMLRENIIIWQDLEFQRQETESKIEDVEKREDVIHKIMEIKDFQDIIFECQNMSIEDGQKKINSIMKKGEISENNSAYQEALNEYQKALTYAKELNVDMEIGRISFKILEIVELNKEVELKFAKERVSKAEKKKDYVIALKYLIQVKDLLSAENDDGKHDKQIQKTAQKIEKIQNHIYETR